MNNDENRKDVIKMSAMNGCIDSVALTNSPQNWNLSPYNA